MGRLLVHMRARRKELGLTIEHLSVKAGISGSFISKIEHGELIGSDATINKLANALGITPGDIRYEQLARDDFDYTDGMYAGEKLVLSQPKKHKFIPGRTYKMQTVEHNVKAGVSSKRKFLRTEGQHHIFMSPGGWLESYTDVQLVGVRIKEEGE